ncbi:nucleotide-diphospho-sugar transferase [Durotheca rogersii]|uniref:nucleotide-diphospho-sugar transferase n=1 Tax=Durotheca rogersii TaxID=419775 RepID=UPI00221F09D1|nr:nucleotide-diphospho-sugar transferase [Durotheca rogersii]KAI5864797.1 nucleotide-diphospho-sugar transferase [Durotheca rogersii]
MPEFTPAEVQSLKASYDEAGQGHVFTYFDSLALPEQKAFFEQLQKIDPARVNKLRELALNPPKEDGEAVLEPLPDSANASILDSKPEDIQRWYDLGLELIGKGEVAVVLLAGGQGTRLGSKAPKGCFDIQLPSHKSLFQIQAERIIKVQKLAAERAADPAKAVIPWFIMTSGPTRGPTEKFFKKERLDELTDEENDNRAKGEPYFGLDPANVTIFEQGVLPCITNDGKFMLASKDKVAVAPDGNGGLYKALQDEGVLDKMRASIKHVHAYCVDNSLAKVADPVFIGFAAEKKVKIATEVVRKRDAQESVGLILQKNGRPDVVEYSEIDEATRQALDPKQPTILKFRAANIVNHYYSFAYLDSMGDAVNRLPPHIARKKIPYFDVDTGAAVADVKAPNGIKLEQFVFDNFKWLDLPEFACFEVRREEEFSPLKNADPARAADGSFAKPPEDSPTTSRKHIKEQGRRWAEAAGATVDNGDADGGLEVSPLTSYGGEGLESFKGQVISQLTI